LGSLNGGSTALPPNAPANTNVSTYRDTNHPGNPGSGREHRRPEYALFGVECAPVAALGPADLVTDSWRKIA